MNTNLIRPALILASGFLVSWVLTYTVRLDSVYISVHRIGERFSQIVPVGHDTGPQEFRLQYVRVEQGWHYWPQTQSARDLNLPERSRTKFARREHLILPAAALAITLLSVFTARGLHSFSGGVHFSTRLLLTNSLFSVLFVGVLVLLRVFLTGVDDGLIQTARLQSAYSDLFKYSGHRTLSMSLNSLIMVYLGVGLAAYLSQVWIGSRMIMVDHDRNHTWGERIGSIGTFPRSNRPMNIAGKAIFIGIILMLILAPWTNTWWGLLLYG
jgi:hypothetical protein